MNQGTTLLFSSFTDEQLLAQVCATKNQEAFCELMGRYTEKVHNLALRITRNHQDTEEILQDVFVTVFNKAECFRGNSAFSSWLYRIAANTAFMKIRKRKRQQAVSIEEVDASTKRDILDKPCERSEINTLSTRHELRAALQDALEILPEDYKLIFVLRDVDGLSNQEVGEIMTLTVPAVKSRLHRSRLMLRKRLRSLYRDYTDDERISVGPQVTAKQMEFLNAA